MTEKQSYYKENLLLLIKRLKATVTKTLEVVDKDIDDELSDDKYLNVLKARRQASEDVMWYLKRIDELENELNGTEESITEKSVIENPSKRFSKKVN
ncbi:hypothetical protein [Flavobacterium psychrophilum]|uniref:Uncharacterized protein n=1 Tax=Flavobacterium psychrophilum TaxID=96345 RepID=A0A7U2NE41_FLAPS|nr:hypothetical protein [Flavobacterium psychrophilum]QRE03505.1 hypothetical protein H0H26_11530 [Flavobacterium psychrophilum]